MSNKVLVIEDEPDIRKTLEYNLSREGYKVEGCGSIEEANTFLENPSYSIILLDLMLPDGSGLDLCKQIKSNPETNETPILILTAKDDEVDNVVGFETASTSDTITLNGSTKGGVTFSKIVCEVLASGKWKVDVVSGCTGTPATPFSAAVS